ncbi:MAG: helicase [Phylliscum demangeonii]|nr:MAG: helicase [Phylliscum demangeonii]
MDDSQTGDERWRKKTNKKHKSWTGDGFLILAGGYAALKDTSGDALGRVKFDSPLLHGSTLSIGGNDVEVDAVITRAEYLKTAPKHSLEKETTPAPKIRKPMPIVVPRAGTKQLEDVLSERPLNVTAPKSDAMRKHFKNPLRSDTVLPKHDGPRPNPRHDPKQPGALVMTRPTVLRPGKQVVDVVVDPVLARCLRPHQREGVRFLYECVMGLRPYAGQGAILADEMGLGKTLQTIALLWTLLKQNPIHEDGPVIARALIVCPATLIGNWRKEFAKWLGNERIGVFVVDGSKKLKDFTHGKSYSVMIIGYEKLCKVQDELQDGAGVDIVVADEGHRLKTAQNKSAQAIRSLNTSRRIILSGTPIQNDLSEFFITVDFVNPGILGTYNAFKKEFEGPIVRSRQPEASRNMIEDGEAKSEELSTLTRQFILRRTADVIANDLPPKTEYILLCKPTAAQVDAYKAVLSSPAFGSVLGSPEASLQLITILKKVCNAPSFIAPKSRDEEMGKGSISDLLSSIPSTITQALPSSASSKLQVLAQLLRQLRSTTQEKIVLVSNYTSTLDLLQQLLAAEGFPFLRLDGRTPAAKRQNLVDSFNRSPASTHFAFLLSAKAGGTGLNLIGASRLVLFDIDWNPATDLQAMARIHRDGQKRDVRIYRLLMAGGLDEKIWQRQITKIGLADSVMNQKTSASSFSVEELRDLFTLDVTSLCQTHDLLGCQCPARSAATDLRSSDAVQGPTVIEIEDDSGDCAGEDGDDGDDGDDDDDDDDDFPELRCLIPASQVDMQAQERRIRQQQQRRASRRRATNGSSHPYSPSTKTSTMQPLMQYTHIDPSTISAAGRDAAEGSSAVDSARSIIIEEDDVLMHVLRQPQNRIKFIFAKTAGGA